MFPLRKTFLVIILCCFSFSCFTQNFVTTWQTTSSGEMITIPTIGSGYSYNVNWGVGEPIDGTTYTGNASHTYAAAGTYTVTITGTFRRIYFNNTGDKDKILSIEEWGSNHLWTSMSRAFEGCTNLVNNASDTPDLTNTTNLARMFFRASSIGGATETGNWAWNLIPSSITSMAQMFREATVFNKDISSWNTTNITNMSNLFRDASAFDQNISSWSTSLVTNMTRMFQGATSFNQNIGGWTTSAVTTMSYMFSGASAFNQNIGGWTVSLVSNMDEMFRDATSFNQNLNSWNVSTVTNMNEMFRGASVFNGNITSWVPSSVLTMANMFRDAANFNQNISSWNVASVTNMSNMFYGATDFNQSIGGWTVSAVTNMANMFRGATSFNQDISGWNVSSVTSMSGMFREATSFNQNISGWTTTSLTNLGSMFRNNGSAFDQNIGGWDISNVTNFNNMFNGSELSPANYNALLIGWNAQTVQPNENLHAGTSRYCSAAAIAAKANMIASDGWSFTDSSELTSFTWTGNTDTDWSDTTNWQDGYDSNCEIDITIPNVTNQPIIGSSTNITADDLTINSSATLTINGGLTLNGNLTTNNGLTLNSGGSLIVLGTSTGDLTYNRSIANAKEWYQISSPVNGETIEDYISNNSLQTGNGNVGLYSYDNSTAVGYLGTGYIFYTPTSTGSFTSGKGYGTQVSSASDVSFTGTMPTSDVTITVATGTIDNANLIGNPFPSYLPANNNAVLTNNLLTHNTGVLSEETLWFWDNTQNDYEEVNNGSLSHYVSPGQGFFVDASGSGSFSFLESWQEHQTTDVFYKKIDTVFRIKLNVSDKNQTKSTKIFYFDNKTLGFDNGYDSSQIVDENATLNIFSRLVNNHDSKNLGIQTLPTENLHTCVIPIGVKGKNELTFKAFITNKPEGYSLLLEDRQSNTFINLDNSNTHTINVKDEINGIGRFYIHLKPNNLNIEQNLINNISVFSSNYKEVTINGLPAGLTSVNIYDILGKTVIKEKFNIISDTSKKLSLLSLNKGLYIVNLKTEIGVLSKKIVLK